LGGRWLIFKAVVMALGWTVDEGARRLLFVQPGGTIKPHLF
jgi:hypothetical protein